ncbi:WXG100 family type VII secretion target [Rhodococcus sp. PvR099]|uniref:WXG100 family type VII secretion target n=1 Tax=Rhodococcus sp. PvR099 TaxID=2806602 RepID=UPI001AE86C63|nr:WXG100 family type VII secretion target [Rhodococcus sp. PvR099]MBP1159791.1 WXG100 family type VII secretion target [Rhodococcus sp. PvR099]
MTESSSENNGLFVDADGVQEAGRFAYKTAQDLLVALRSAGSEVDSLMSGGWSGNAAAAYGAGWRELFDGGVQVFESLSSMAELLGVTAENYARQDTAAAGSISSLRLD